MKRECRWRLSFQRARYMETLLDFLFDVGLFHLKIEMIGTTCRKQIEGSVLNGLEIKHIQ